MSPLELTAFSISIVAGTALLVVALRFAIRGARIEMDDAGYLTQLVYFGRAFRCFIVGLSAIVAASGFAFDHRPLAWLFVVIGTQELYESSVLIAVVRSAEVSQSAELARR